MFSTDIALDEIERGEQVSINWESSSGVFYCKRNMMESICCFEFLIIYICESDKCKMHIRYCFRYYLIKK